MENYKGMIWATWDPAAPVVRRVHRRLQALPRSAPRRVGRARGRHRGDRRHPQVADALQLEVPGRELLRRSLPRRQPPLGGHGRHRSERQGAARQGRAQPGALARRAIPRAGPLDDRVSPPARRAAHAVVPGRADSGRVLPCTARRSASAAAAPSGACFGGPGTVFPNASPLARQPRTIAAWHPRGPHQTEAWRWYLVDADAPAEVKDFLRHYYIRYSGPVGTDRAGRHGELELRARRQPRHHRPPAIPTTTRWAWAAPRATSRITASGCPD